MAKSGLSPDQRVDTSGVETLSSGLPSPPDDQRPSLGDVPAFAMVHDVATPPAQSRRGAFSAASSTASNHERAPAETKLKLAEAEHDLALKKLGNQC